MSFTPARFSTGHLHALAALLGNKGRHATWANYFGACVGKRDRGAALQAWMYHLLGGEASGLKMPTDWKLSTSSKHLLARAEKSVAAAARECARWAQAAVQLGLTRAPSSPLLTPPSHPSHAGRDARASRRVRLQGARDDKNAQGGTEWQHKVNREKSAGVFKLRELVHKDRAAQKQDAVSRRDAEADAEAMATRVRERETSLERLRGTRQQTLLDTIEEERAAFAEQTASNMATIVELTRRRTANMRKILDYNLSNRRAAQATETAKQAQQALNDYCVRDLASDIDLARLEMVEAELVAMRAELVKVKEKALRVKYEAVAHPPKKYFFKSGAYTTKVDLTALKARRPQRRTPRGA